MARRFSKHSTSRVLSSPATHVQWPDGTLDSELNCHSLLAYRVCRWTAG